MLKNYLKIAFRNLSKHVGYSFINITGLALGITCAIFIFMWVQDELNYDRYNKNADNIYRVEEDQYYSGKAYHVNVTPYPCGPVFKEKIPEVVNAARMNYAGVLVRYEDKSFYETRVVGIDSTYLEMFTFEFLRGDINTALDGPHSIIINDEIANKYFGNDDPVGKILSLNNSYDFTVTGVFKKLPHNVSRSFEIAFPFKFFKEIGRWSESWGNNSITTFVQLIPNPNIELVNKKMTDLLRENHEESTTDYMVAPFTRMYLHSYFGYGNSAGNIKYIYIFSSIAVFILLIACINFMNLSTARSANRTKEIGVRKVVGASRASLIKQFYGESFILSIIGLIISIVVVLLLLEEFNAFTGKNITLNILYDGNFIIGVLLITFITSIISGSYPALYLSAFNPVAVLKGNKNISGKNSLFRRLLVIIQFSMSIFLIVSTFVVYNQMIFMKNKDLGYDSERLIYIQMRGNLAENYPTLKTELEHTKGVVSVTASNHPPNSIGSNSGGAEWDGKNPDDRFLIGTNVVDYNFCKTLGIEILEGRGFSPEYPADEMSKEDTVGGFLVNEETVKIMGISYKEAVGARFEFMGGYGTIIGVMKNFHYNSIHDEIEPLAMILVPERFSFIAIRLAAGNVTETLDAIKNTWSSVVPNYPFAHRFLDEDFERWYRRETRMVSLLEIFSVVAIIIACLGLFGLASFTAEQRTKEIGIRKVLGASEINLTLLMCKEFVILVIVSNIIAWPLAYYSSISWLNDFAYRIDLGISFFIFSGLLSVIIALITVGFQAVKVSIANPVVSLKYE